MHDVCSITTSLQQQALNQARTSRETAATVNWKVHSSYQIWCVCNTEQVTRQDTLNMLTSRIWAGQWTYTDLVCTGQAE